MADFVTNKLTIRCKDSNQKEKIKKLIFNYDEKNVPIFTMTKLLPIPEGLSDNPGYTEYGYDWCCAVWGTKWDARYPEILESGATIIIIYDTAWDPNTYWVRALCRYIRNISFSLDKNEFKDIYVTHSYFNEYEDIGSEMSWTMDDSYIVTENVSISEKLSELFSNPRE